MLTLQAGIEDLQRAKALMSEANDIMNRHASKLKTLEKENAELKDENARLKDELDDLKGNAAGFQPDAYMPLPLDADGKPIHVGDWVYFDGDAEGVYAISWNGAHWEVGLSGYVKPQAPEECRLVPGNIAFDADGIPILKGETVYVDGKPEPFEVTDVFGSDGGYRTVSLKDRAWFICLADAQRLSHKKPEPPDSWEKLEEDVLRGGASSYWQCRIADSCKTCPHGTKLSGRSCWRNRDLDILARAKRLAGVE